MFLFNLVFWFLFVPFVHSVHALVPLPYTSFVTEWNERQQRAQNPWMTCDWWLTWEGRWRERSGMKEKERETRTSLSFRLFSLFLLFIPLIPSLILRSVIRSITLHFVHPFHLSLVYLQWTEGRNEWRKREINQRKEKQNNQNKRHHVLLFSFFIQLNYNGLSGSEGSVN